MIEDLELDGGQGRGDSEKGAKLERALGRLLID